MHYKNRELSSRLETMKRGEKKGYFTTQVYTQEVVRDFNDNITFKSVRGKMACYLSQLEGKWRVSTVLRLKGRHITVSE